MVDKLKAMMIGGRRPVILQTGRYAFCSNITSQRHMLVDPGGLQVIGLANWKDSRYTPTEFEYPSWLKADNLWAKDDEEVERLVKILDKPGKNLKVHEMPC